MLVVSSCVATCRFCREPEDGPARHPVLGAGLRTPSCYEVPCACWLSLVRSYEASKGELAYTACQRPLDVCGPSAHPLTLICVYNTPIYPTDSAPDSLSVPPVVPPYIPDRFGPRLPECPSRRSPHIPDRFLPQPGPQPRFFSLTFWVRFYHFKDFKRNQA